MPRRRESDRRPRPRETARPQRSAFEVPGWSGAAALTLLAAAAGAEIFRLGFFADDFHFLDVARRVPFLETLGGQFGIYPWYRPLSREAYFALVALAGPAGAVVARTLSLAAVVACTCLIDRVGSRLVGARAARFGAILFATFEFTRFLAAWASGFQDLLGLLLVLAALDAMLRGRVALALLAAGLAPFAKETSLVVFPLLGLLIVIDDRGPGKLRTLVALAGVLVAVAALHLGVRAAWKGVGTTADIKFTPSEWMGVLTDLAGGFVGRAAVLEPWAVILAGLATLAAMLAIAVLPRSERVQESSPPRSRVAFVAAAAGVGLLPLLAGQWLRVSAAHAYYGFPAAPWLALLAGAALAQLRPALLSATVVVALTGWNVLALGYRSPDLGIQPGWNFTRWDWREAMRLSAVSERLAGDLRAELATRPESLVICYSGIPVGSFFQTEDGPAARVALGDPTVRSYWVNATPYGAVSGRAVLLEFDLAALHLVKFDPATRSLDTQAAAAVVMEDAGPAAALAAIAGAPDPRLPEMGFFGAAAALLAEGPAAYWRELRRAGLTDSAGPAPHEMSWRLLGSRPELAAAYEDVLRHPLDAGRRVAMAERFAAAGAGVTAAVELRIALALAPRPAADRMRLAGILEHVGGLRSARRELERVAEAVPGSALASEARARIDSLDRRGAATAPRTPVRVLGRPLDTPGRIPDLPSLP